MSKRIKFFIGHLSVSLLIAIATAILIFLVWYPQPLAKAVGVTSLFVMLIIIDVIIGPLLGLLVYKEGKNTLKFDLAVVILTQLSAFTFGFYTIAQGRPLWIVASNYNFQLVKNNEINDQSIQYAAEAFKNRSWIGPQFVGIRTDLNHRSHVSTVQNGQGAWFNYPARYISIDKVENRFKYAIQDLTMLEKFNSKEQVISTLKRYPQANAWMPLAAPVMNMTILVNKDTAEIIKIVDLRPWK